MKDKLKALEECERYRKNLQRSIAILKKINIITAIVGIITIAIVIILYLGGVYNG